MPKRAPRTCVCCAGLCLSGFLLLLGRKEVLNLHERSGAGEHTARARRAWVHANSERSALCVPPLAQLREESSGLRAQSPTESGSRARRLTNTHGSGGPQQPRAGRSRCAQPGSQVPGTARLSEPSATRRGPGPQCPLCPRREARESLRGPSVTSPFREGRAATRAHRGCRSRQAASGPGCG